MLTKQESTVNIVTLLTTNTCTAECSHCSMNSDTKRRGRLTLAQGQNSISNAKAAGAKVIVFAGGEPTLLKDDLFQLIAHATTLGLPTRLVTNASWASSPLRARQVLTRLSDAGLTELNISYDDYHQPYVPPYRIKHAVQASYQLEFRAVVIAICSASDNTVTPSYVNRLIEAEFPVLPSRGEESASSCTGFSWKSIYKTKYAISVSPLARLGRAADALEDAHYPLGGINQALVDQPCRACMRDLAIAPDHHLMPCCGVEFSGNEFMDLGAAWDFADRLADARSNDVIRIINMAGPAFLQRVINRSIGESFDLESTRPTSICEVCERLFKSEKNKDVLRELVDTGRLKQLADQLENQCNALESSIS